MNLLTYGDYKPLFSESKYNVKRKDIDSDESFISETGESVRNRIRDRVVTISVSYTNLTQEQLTEICEEISNETIDLIYFWGGDYKSGTFKVTDDSQELIVIKTENDEISESKWNLDFTLEEL